MLAPIQFSTQNDKNGLSRAIKVIILCFVWYGASSASNIINKIVLNGKYQKRSVQ